MVTSAWHILALVLAVGSIFLIYYLVTLLIQVRETLKTLQGTLTLLQNEVAPVINNVEGITSNVEQMTGRADNIFENVQTKTVDTLGVVDSLKSNIDILKHTLFLLLSRLSKYSRALGFGIKVGVSSYKESKPANIPVFNKQEVLLVPPTIKIVDHLEIKSK